MWQDQIHARYLTSVFIGNSTSIDLDKKFEKIQKYLPAPNLLQVSMDGPSVNWKMYDNFATAFSTEHNCNFLKSVVTCIIIVKSASKNGATATC